MAARTAPWESAIRHRSGANIWRSAPDRVPDPTDRLDHIAGARVGELPPQVVHVQVDDLRRRVEGEPPHVLLDLRAREDPALAAEQAGQELELLRGQLDGTAVDRDPVGPDVELDGAGRESPRPTGPPGEGLDPGQQLL